MEERTLSWMQSTGGSFEIPSRLLAACEASPQAAHVYSFGGSCSGLVNLSNPRVSKYTLSSRKELDSPRKTHRERVLHLPHRTGLPSPSQVETQVEERVGRGGDVAALAAADFGPKLAGKGLMDDAVTMRVSRAGARGV